VELSVNLDKEVKFKVDEDVTRNITGIMNNIYLILNPPSRHKFSYPGSFSYDDLKDDI
jgi:hypothetical protein